MQAKKKKNNMKQNSSAEFNVNSRTRSVLFVFQHVGPHYKDEQRCKTFLSMIHDVLNDAVVGPWILENWKTAAQSLNLIFRKFCG